MRRRHFLLMLAAAPALGAGANLDAEALWQRLRGGGLVLLVRHAATDPGVGDPPGFRLGECATQRQLSEAGRLDARALGAALRSHGVKIGPVWSSRWCRCLDTARLAFGRVEAAPLLDSIFQVDDAAARTRLAELRARLAGLRVSSNLVLVTHDVNIRAMVDESVAQGEVVVARIDGAGRLEALGRLRVRA
jgi:broad specificity phosphatase PhoE